MGADDAINDVAAAEDPRLNYPSHHDWAWIDLGKHYEDWLDAAYPAINRLTRERDQARADAAAATADEVMVRGLLDECRTQRDHLAAALEAIIAEPWLSGGPDACTIASAALYPDAPLE